MNKQCTAFDLYAILKDYYEQMEGLVARSVKPMSTPANIKLKRRKLITDNLMVSTEGSKNHYFLLFRNKHFNVESLMQTLDQLNQGCTENDKELSQVI